MKSAATGASGGGLGYGYAIAMATGANGQPVRGSRRIDEAEAAVVRRIFRDYAHGRSPRRIAHELNAAGVPGPSGVPWGPSTINGNRARGSGILNNELYIGRLVWNRVRFLKDPDTGKRVSRLNPPEAWVTQKVPALRIVPQELWDQGKARQRAVVKDSRPDRRAKADRPVWDRRRPRYLFSGLVRGVRRALLQDLGQPVRLRRGPQQGPDGVYQPA